MIRSWINKPYFQNYSHKQKANISNDTDTVMRLNTEYVERIWANCLKDGVTPGQFINLLFKQFVNYEKK